MSDRELSEAINERFNLSTSRLSIQALRRYYGIIKGRDKWKPYPLLTEITDERGYVKIKISNDKKPGNKNWILKHTYLYEQAHGKVPKGYNVIFLDGNKNNFSLDNLAVVSDDEQIRLSKLKLRFSDPTLTQTGIAILKLNKKIKARRGNEKTNAGK